MVKCSMIPLPEIETGILIERVPALSAAKLQIHSWNRVGDRLAADLLGPKLPRPVGSRLWLRVRMEMYRLLATQDPMHADMRERLEKCPPESTDDLISLLSSWLAETTDIPDNAAAPLITVILFGVAGGSAMDLLPSEAEHVG